MIPRSSVPVLLLLFTACGAAPRAVPAPTPAATAMFEQVKAMAGTWDVKVPGQPDGACTFTISSGGSIVREIMFPGSPHEMTNVYHLDGDSLLLTHYCAAGNQPRMRARPAGDGVLRFAFDGVTDLQAGEHVMDSLVLTVADQDHATADWSSRSGDEASTIRFELSRRR